MNTRNESSGMAMSIESGVVGAIIAKVGAAKALALGAALIGAAIMAVFRPPLTRKEMFLQGAVALGSSLLFGDFFVTVASNYFALSQDSLVAPVHGLIGALSWGIFGGLAVLRDKTGKDPVATVKEIKDVISK